MEQLQHNGVLVPHPHERKGLAIMVEKEEIQLTRDQEEMALAWAKKVGTPYVEDPIFAKNFHRDFSKKLGISVRPGDIDYSEVLSFVEKERNWKLNLSKEEKKQIAAQRKTQREEKREFYGYAWIDGLKMDVANYAAEPSSIFMGRGKHPLRGCWKEGPRQEDIELNLSPDSPRPPGNWKRIIWQPNNMWIARWRDKLSGKMKYVWLSDSSILKQKKDIEKFDKAKELLRNLGQVQRHIWENLDADDIRRRKTATVCFLIDKLKIRVGDEKDPDEADTVGASTLRPEHIRYDSNNTVIFNFLGKDSVPHVFKVRFPDTAIRNLKDFAANAEFTLFDGVRSKHVSEFLDEVMSGLSAKVFRTYYASDATETKLKKADVKLEDPEYFKKYIATMANLEAAKVCNHRRTIPKTWESSLEKKKYRLDAQKKRAKDAQKKLRQKAKEQEERHTDRMKKQKIKLETLKNKLGVYQQQHALKKQKGKSVQAIKKRISLQRKAITRQSQRLRELKTKHTDRLKKLEQTQESRRQRDESTLDKLKLKIETQKETRDYNLTTSLKSYIDPRIYYEWGKRVNYDWKLCYPKTLQRKFSWVETDQLPTENE